MVSQDLCPKLELHYMLPYLLHDVVSFMKKNTVYTRLEVKIGASMRRLWMPGIDLSIACAEAAGCLLCLCACWFFPCEDESLEWRHSKVMVCLLFRPHQGII